MITATTAGAAATGFRAWLAARSPAWLGAAGLRWITVGLVLLALAASAGIATA